MDAKKLAEAEKMRADTAEAGMEQAQSMASATEEDLEKKQGIRRLKGSKRKCSRPIGSLSMSGRRVNQ